MLNIFSYSSCVKYFMLLMLLLFVRFLYLILKLKHGHLCDKNVQLYHNETSLQRLLRNKRDI